MKVIAALAAQSALRDQKPLQTSNMEKTTKSLTPPVLRPSVDAGDNLIILSFAIVGGVLISKYIL